MKLPLAVFWSVILVISILASCTVEKRLYQRGYHVEWHKRNQASNETKAIAEKRAFDHEIIPDAKKPEAVTAPGEDKIIVAESETPLHVSIASVRDHASGAAENPAVNGTSSSDQPIQTLDQAHEKQPQLKQLSKREGGPSGVTKGLLMILMGLLLILMGFLFQNILGVFGTILLIIFGLGGTIMIVVGIVIMILG